jgi:glycosyltransferase involved in cell wall biosynthesis
MIIKELKEKKLSVAFVVHTFIPETYGGGEQNTLRLAVSLKNYNINSFILAPKIQKNTPLESLEKTIPVKRFKLNNLPNLGGRYIFSFITWSLKLIYWLIKNSNKFDIIHVIHGRLHSVPAIFAAKILKKPVLVKLGRGGKEYFDINAVRKKKIIGNFIFKYILKNTTGWIANSKMIETDLKDHNIKDELIHKIYNGIDIDRVRINKFHINKKFLVIGRLDEEKNCDQIIRVFSKLSEDLNVKLIFLGDGPLEEDLLKMTKQLNQSHRIFFKGAVNNVKEHLVASNFYISASKSEGMSNSLLEAMSLGIPAITSNVSGVNEIVSDNRNGFIFEIGDEKIFCEKIIKAISCNEFEYTNMSRSASEHMLKNFSINLITKKYIKLYNTFY